MQGVWVFASAAARDAAVTSPQEGNFAYLKDTNVTTYYTGSAWANLNTTGMTNPMTTTGDTIYSSSGSTPARLGIGTTGQVLTVAGGVPSWAAPAGGSRGLKQIIPTSVAVGSGTATVSANGLITFTTVDSLSINGCFSATYKNYEVYINYTQSSNQATYWRMRVGGVDNTTASSYLLQQLVAVNATVGASRVAQSYWDPFYGNNNNECFAQCAFYRPFDAVKTGFSTNTSLHPIANGGMILAAAQHTETTSYDGFTWYLSAGTITGTMAIYGLEE